VLHGRSSVRARPPPSWTCIWHSICAAGSMPTTKSISWAAAGPSPQPNAQLSPSFIIPYASSGPSPSPHCHPKTSGRKSWGITPSKLSPFEFAHFSPFEPPPTLEAKNVDKSD
jgi:hypothetical protein